MTKEERVRWLKESEIAKRMIDGKAMTVRETIERGAKSLLGDYCIWDLLEFEEGYEYGKMLDELRAALNDPKMEEKELIRMITECEQYSGHYLTFPYQAYLMGLIEWDED